MCVCSSSAVAAGNESSEVGPRKKERRRTFFPPSSLFRCYRPIVSSSSPPSLFLLSLTSSSAGGALASFFLPPFPSSCLELRASGSHKHPIYSFFANNQPLFFFFFFPLPLCFFFRLLFLPPFPPIFPSGPSFACWSVRSTAEGGRNRTGRRTRLLLRSPRFPPFPPPSVRPSARPFFAYRVSPSRRAYRGALASDATKVKGGFRGPLGGVTAPSRPTPPLLHARRSWV